jgi:hypothetical protein
MTTTTVSLTKNPLMQPTPVIPQPNYGSSPSNSNQKNWWNQNSLIPGFKNGDLAGSGIDAANGQIIKKANAAWKGYAESSANDAFNQNVIRNSAGQFEKGSNAMAGQFAQSAVNQDFESGLKGATGNTLEFLSKPFGGTIFSFGVGTTLDLMAGDSPDEAIGENAVSSVASGGILAIGACAPGPGWIFDAGALVVGLANSWLYNRYPAVRNFENGVGHDIMNLLGGDASQPGADNISKKTGRLSISVGDKYHSGIDHAGVIKLQKDQVDNFAKEILKSTDSFCADMKKTNNCIPKALEDMKAEVQNYLANVIATNYPYLTYADLENEMAKYPIDAMYSEDDVNTANSNIDKLGENLAKVSSSIKQVAKGMKELDQSEMEKFEQGNMFGTRPGTPTYGIQAKRSWK